MDELWLLLTFFFSLFMYYFLKNRLAVFFPSSKRMVEVILEFANPEKNDVLYDLGSGDGRILVEAAKRGVRVVGIEQNPLLNWIARRRTKGFENVRIIHGDIFDQRIGEATIIIAYLSRILMRRLQEKIEKEAKEGTKIILVDHEFPDWKPIKEERVGLIPIRLYVKRNNFIPG